MSSNIILSAEIDNEIRKQTAMMYKKYPLPSVQDFDDMSQEVRTQLLIWMQDVARPTVETIKAKICYILKDVRRRNNRLGLYVRKSRNIYPKCHGGLNTRWMKTNDGTDDIDMQSIRTKVVEQVEGVPQVVTSMILDGVSVGVIRRLTGMRAGPIQCLKYRLKQDVRRELQNRG